MVSSNEGFANVLQNVTAKYLVFRLHFELQRNLIYVHVYWTTKERYIKFSLKLRIFHLNKVKESRDIYIIINVSRLIWRAAVLSKISKSRYSGQFKCTGVRTKSNNKTWRVVFRWMIKEDANLKCTKRWKTMNYIHFNNFRHLLPALSTSATRILIWK